MNTTVITAIVALGIGFGGGAWVSKKSTQEQVHKLELSIAQINKQHADELVFSREEEIRLIQKYEHEKEMAREEYDKNLSVFKDDATSSRRAADRLRDTVATQRWQLSQLSEQAIRAYADAANVVFSQCGAEYQRMAEVADQCTIDLKLMQDSWPKSSK